LVDKSLILRKISELETYIEQISEYSDITSERYRGDWKSQRVIERTLQMMIENCADIANHIVADKGLRSPSSYADTFKVLQENNIISEELYGTMEKMAKFRNVVVHQYEQVDADIVVIIMRKHLGDFGLYKNALLLYMKNKP